MTLWPDDLIFVIALRISFGKLVVAIEAASAVFGGPVSLKTMASVVLFDSPNCLSAENKTLYDPMRRLVVAAILLLASASSHPIRTEEAPLAACANWVIAHGTDNAIQLTLATLLLNVAREVPVRQKAFQERDGTLHVMDVTTNQGSADDVLLIVAGPEHTRNVFFVTRTDGILRRTASSYEENPATVVPNTAHLDLFAQEVRYWRDRLPKD